MSLLQVVSDAMKICGLTAPSAVMSSTKPLVQHFAALLNVEGDELSKYHGWRRLKIEWTITGDGTETLFDLPADFTRFMPGDVMYWQDGVWQILKEVSDEEMQAAKARNLAPIWPIWRLFGDQVEFYPALPDGQVIRTEYRTEYWVTDSTGADAKARPTADSDLFRVPEQVLTLGLVWRFRESKGFSYDEAFRSYQMARERYAFNDRPRPPLRTGRRLINDGLLAGVVGETPPVIV